MKDPVFGMQVTEDSAFNVEHKKETYFFCSERCLNKFKLDPTEYLHSENKQKGCCGHCGTDSPPDTHKKATDSNEVYTCPMHPEIEQIGPGSCPKCGMALEPKDLLVIQTKTQFNRPMRPLTSLAEAKTYEEQFK